MHYNFWKKQQGFTLIEMVIGIVVFSIAMTMITSLILPRAEQSVDPIFQVRAAKLADTLLNEIRGKAYDNNSNGSQTLLRCDEEDENDDVVNSCTSAVNFGQSAVENEDSEFFNDVDDYHLFDNSNSPLDSSETYDDIYSGYSYVVNVIYDGDYDGVSDTNTSAKLITVTVTMPNGESLDFATYRSNY